MGACAALSNTCVVPCAVILCILQQGTNNKDDYNEVALHCSNDHEMITTSITVDEKIRLLRQKYGVGEEARIQLNLGNENRMSVSRFMY